MSVLTRLLVFSALFLASQTAFAVDLANRLGVGYSNQMSTDLPSFTAQYYPNSMMGMSVALGVDTEKNSSDFGLLFKLYRIVFTEKNMNFYMGWGSRTPQYQRWPTTLAALIIVLVLNYQLLLVESFSLLGLRVWVLPSKLG